MATRYVDPTALFDGIGTTTSPWKTWLGKSITSGDQIWIRRAGATTLPSSYSFPAGIGFYGWPKAGDNITLGNNGATMPPSAPTGWATDPNDYAEIRSTSSTITATLNPTLILPGVGNTTLNYFRLKFNNTSTDISVGHNWVNIVGDYRFMTHIAYCYFTSSGPGAASSTQGTSTFYNCIFEITGTNNYALLITSTPFGSTGPDHKFDLCIFRDGVGHYSASPASSSIVLIGQRDYTATGFFRCAFIGNGGATLLNVNQANGISSFGIDSKTALIDCTFDDTARVDTSFGPAILAAGCCWGTNVQVTTKTGVSVGARSTAAINARPSIWRFSKLTQTANYSPLLKAQCGNTEVDVINFSPNGSTVTPIQIDPGVRLKMTNAAAPAIRAPNILIKDEAGVVESWHRIAMGGDIRKSSVFRTGGASYSLKFQFDQDANEKRPLIFGEPGREQINQFVKAGSRTITVFGAYKGFSTTLLARDVWFELEYFDTTGIHRVTASSRNSAILSGASTWTGDTGLTKFSIALTFTQAKSVNIPIRLYYRHYDVGSILYLDPHCQVT